MRRLAKGSSDVNVLRGFRADDTLFRGLVDISSDACHHQLRIHLDFYAASSHSCVEVHILRGEEGAARRPCIFLILWSDA